MIFFYRILTFLLFPVFVAVIFLRKYFNKEDPIRFKEKININESFFPKNKNKNDLPNALIFETQISFCRIIRLQRLQPRFRNSN